MQIVTTETIYMKYQSLFSGRKNIHRLSSAELAQSFVMIKINGFSSDAFTIMLMDVLLRV